MKIFPKTFLYTLALLVLIAMLANGLIYFLMPTAYTKQKTENLSTQADQLKKELEAATREDVPRLTAKYSAAGQTNITVNIGEDTYALVVWRNGLGAGGQTVTYTTVSPNTVARESQSSAGTVTDSGVSMTVPRADASLDPVSFYGTTQALRTQRSFTMGNEEGTITLSMTMAPVDEAVGVIVSLLPVSIVLCIVIAIVFSLLYARAITRPIKAISAETRHMTLLERNVQCKIQSKDEFSELATNVNELYSKLLSTIDSLEAELKKVAAGEKAKTEFLRAASHELKTPATAVSVIMDNMILGIGKYRDHEQWLPKCKELVDSLSDKLCDILDASRLEEISEPSVTKSVEMLCSEVLEPHLIIARARGLSLYVDWSASFAVTAPPKLLRKALSNIFSNAVQYTMPGRRFSVYCRGRSLIVENECKPIPKEQLERLYEPFFRLDASRSRETGGNGLGLYIVKTTLEHIELDYRFEQMTSPEGMRFTIKF